MQSLLKYVLLGMCIGHFYMRQSVGLQLDPSVRSIEAFAGDPFEINCDDEAIVEANKGLVLEWVNPQGEVIGSSRDVPKPILSESKHRMSRVFAKFKDLARNMMSMIKAYAALVIQNKQSSGVYRCVLRDVSLDQKNVIILTAFIHILQANSNEIVKQMPIKVTIFKTMDFEASFEMETSALKNLPFELACNVEFDPDLTNTKIVWMKDGRKVIQNPRVFVRESVPPNVKSRLVFKRIRPDDVGEYACRASQSTGSVSQTRMAVTSLQVKGMCLLTFVFKYN